MPAKLALLAFVAATCSGQSTLRQYLNLTNAQASSIVQLDHDYTTSSYSNQVQTIALNTQLFNLFAMPAPDPMQLGNIAVQLELIRRDQVSKQTAVQINGAAQFTAAQLALVQNLIAASTLLPLVTDATCAYLLQPAPGYWSDTGTFVPNIRYDARLFQPYIPPAPTGSFCNSAIFPISVREFLSLSDPQIAVIFETSAAYNDLYARRQARLADLNQQTQTTLAAGNVDPTILGLAYTEIARIGQELKDQSAQLRSVAQAQLNPPQKAKLQTLQDAQNLQNAGVIQNAVDCNLILLPIGSAYSGTTVNGYLSYCQIQ